MKILTALVLVLVTACFDNIKLPRAELQDDPISDTHYTFGGYRKLANGDSVIIIRVAYKPLVGDQDRYLYGRTYCPRQDVWVTPSMEPGDLVRGYSDRCRPSLYDFDTAKATPSGDSAKHSYKIGK